MQQFEASALYTVVGWHKQGEVDSECILHISIVLAIRTPKLSNLVKIWQSSKEKVGHFWHTPYMQNAQCWVRKTRH